MRIPAITDQPLWYHNAPSWGNHSLRPRTRLCCWRTARVISPNTGFLWEMCLPGVDHHFPMKAVAGRLLHCNSKNTIINISETMRDCFLFGKRPDFIIFEDPAHLHRKPACTLVLAGLHSFLSLAIALHFSCGCRAAASFVVARKRWFETDGAWASAVICPAAWNLNSLSAWNGPGYYFHHDLGLKRFTTRGYIIPTMRTQSTCNGESLELVDKEVT